MSLFKLIIAFVLLYIVFVQGRQVYLEIYRFFKKQWKQNKPEVTITHIPPSKKKPRKEEGEYVDFEEID